MAPLLRAWRSGLRPKERQCGLDELRCGVEEDRSVTAIGHDPKRRARNGAVHVNRHLRDRWNRRSFDSGGETPPALRMTTAGPRLRCAPLGMTAQKKSKTEKAPCYSHGAFIYVGDDLLSRSEERRVDEEWGTR